MGICRAKDDPCVIEVGVGEPLVTKKKGEGGVWVRGENWFRGSAEEIEKGGERGPEEGGMSYGPGVKSRIVLEREGKRVSGVDVVDKA